MSKLKEYLEECKVAYYAGNPIISDDQYDHLEEICGEDLSVGTNRGRVKHWYRMYSLQKIYTDELYPPKNLTNCIVTPKLDGAAIALRYLNGELDSVVTRGNGEYGEDITHLFKYTIKSVNEVFTWYLSYVPKYIKSKGAIQITGEIVAPKETPNARNYAAGALNLKSAEEFENKDVRFIAYDWQPFPYPDYSTILSTLHDFMGFDTVNDKEVTKEYPQDGVVYRLDDNYEYQNLGYTNKHPRGAFALKERSEGIRTTILDVIWQTGKSGKVTPVALLDPIVINGATVSRATLNNVGFIEALGVQIGDSVMVERAGGIIPRIIKKAE